MSCNCHGAEDGSEKRDFQYAVKIVSGRISEKHEGKGPLPTGSYYTKVNVHNPSRCDCVTFKWKVAIGYPNLKVGPISAFHSATLCADEAFEIVNQDFVEAFSIRPRIIAADLIDSEIKETAKVLPTDAKSLPEGIKLPAHFEGWLVIETPEPLDVVAVYGTGPEAAAGTINAFHTERVQPRVMVPCEDLHGNISTGVAMWQVKRPGSNDYSYAFLSGRADEWIAAPSGSTWLTPSAADKDGKPIGGEPVGEYSYRLPFKLCSGFEAPRIQLLVSADDSVKVKLNGNVVGGAGVNLSSHKAITVTSGFKTGQNYLEIIVINADIPSHRTGLALQGSINVKGGRCPGDGGIANWGCPGITYQAYLEDTGIFDNPSNSEWQDWVKNWEIAGTEDQGRRLEAFRANLFGQVPPGVSIQYRAYVEKKLLGQIAGWQGWVDEGMECGSTLDQRRIEGVTFRFKNGVKPPHWSIQYRVHQRSTIFTPGPKYDEKVNDIDCGYTGENRGIEALWLKINC